MAQHPLFPGLIFDENDQPLETETVGQESFYIVDDNGFRRDRKSTRLNSSHGS